MAVKLFNLKSKTSSVDKKISLFAMVSISLLAIFNFQNVIDNYVGLGLSATVAFLVAVVFFLFPFIFIIAEFASLVKGSKSGLTSWIKTAIGRKTAFLTSFMFWFANLTFFFSAVPSRINYLSFAVTGQDFTNNDIYNNIIPWIAVAFFLVVTFVSTLNTKKISKFTSFGGSLMIGITLFFFVFAIIGWLVGLANPSALIDSEAPGVVQGSELNIWGDAKGFGFGWLSSFIWVLMAADGGQSLGVYVNDVKGGKKTFIRAMLISVSIIGIAYVFGTLLTSVFPPVGGLKNGWANSFANLFSFVLSPMGVSQAASQQISFILIGSIFFISTVGGLIVWTSAPVKVMFSEIQPGIFGQRLAKENKNGVCSFGTWIQFLIVVPLMLFLMLSKGDLNDSLQLIKDSAGWIGLLPWIVIFISYVNLRWKHEDEERSFKFGNRKFGISIGLFLSIITAIILCLTFIDRAEFDKPYNQWKSDWYLGMILKVVMVILILVPAYLWYYFKFEHQMRGVKIANNLGLSHELITMKYNFISKLKYKYYFNESYQALENHKNKILFEVQRIINEKYSIIDSLTKKSNQATSKEEVKKIKEEIKKINNKIKRLRKKALIKIKNAENYHNLRIQEAMKVRNEQYKKQYLSVYVPYINKLKEQQKSKKSKAYSNFMNLDVESNIIKDIDLDSTSIFEQLNVNESGIRFDSRAIYDYGFFSKKNLRDRIVVTDDKLLLVKDNAQSLVGKQYDTKNIKAILKAKTNSIKVINSGKWIELDKVEIISIENSQIESFSIYVQNAESLVRCFK